MNGFNKVILIGRLGQDPEVRELPSGSKRASFSIATTDAWTDRTSGEKVEQTHWHRIVAWARTAELAGEYLSKGRLVCVQGRLQYRRWTDKEGQEKHITEVVAESLEFLDSNKAAGERQAA